VKQLALPSAPEPKLLPGEVEPYYMGMELASGELVTVVERYYADGRYELYIGGKLIEGSPYWHRKPPFVLMDKKWSTP
jgi:hypothetical protein